MGWSDVEPVLPHGSSWGEYKQGSAAGGSWYRAYLKVRAARLRNNGAVFEVQLWAMSGSSTDGDTTYSYRLAHRSGSTYTATSSKSVHCTSKVNYALKWTMYYTLDSVATGATVYFNLENISQSTGWVASCSVTVPEEILSSDVSVYTDRWAENEEIKTFDGTGWRNEDLLSVYEGTWKEA